MCAHKEFSTRFRTLRLQIFNSKPIYLNNMTKGKGCGVYINHNKDTMKHLCQEVLGIVFTRPHSIF